MSLQNSNILQQSITSVEGMTAKKHKKMSAKQIILKISH